MIPRLKPWLTTASCIVLAGFSLQAATYKLNDGQTMSGEPIAPNADGIVLKLGETTFSARIAWTNFTEASLLELAKDNEIKKFVAKFLFNEDEITVTEKKPTEIKVHQPPRISRPGETGLISGVLHSPVGLLLLGILYVANLYAAYQIGLYRAINPVVSIGASAILPILAPIAFLCIPNSAGSGGESGGEEEYEDEEEDSAGEPEAEAESAPAPQRPAPAAQAAAQSTVYERGQYTFNRRFFETKLAGFLRTVPSEEDKDLELVVESLRGTHVATRIARIQPSDLALMVSKGGASAEVQVPFAEIKTVTVRRKRA